MTILCDTLQLQDLGTENLQLLDSIRRLGINIEEAMKVIHIDGFQKKASKLLSFFSIPQEQKAAAIKRAIADFAHNALAEEDKPQQIIMDNLPEVSRKVAREIMALGVSQERIAKLVYSSSFISRAEKALHYFSGSRIKQRYAIDKLIENHVELEKKPRPRRCTKPYMTFKRMRLLAAVVENPDIDTETAAAYATMSKRHASNGLRLFLKDGLVICNLTPTNKKIWKTTANGVTKVSQWGVTFLKGGDNSKNCNISFKKVTPSIKTIGVAIETAQTISKELRKLGWIAVLAREVLQKYNVDYLLKMVRSVQNNSGVKNPGAYLYKILFEKVDVKNRIEGFKTKVLRSVSSDVKGMFEKYAGGKDIEVTKALAYSVKKAANRMAKRGVALGAGDVSGILGWVEKRMRGVIIRT